MNVLLENSKLNKLKSRIKNKSEVILRLLSNTIDETSFTHKLLLTNKQVKDLRKAFENNLSVNIKLSKAQLSKIVQSGGFLGKFFGPLLKTRLPLMKNVIRTSAKTSDAGIHKYWLSN